MFKCYVYLFVLVTLSLNAWGQIQKPSDITGLYTQGRMMMWGIDGCKKDVKTGYIYLMEAADKGAVDFYREKMQEGDTQMELIYGLCFIEGHGVEDDPAKAYQIISSAYDHGEQQAAYIVERLSNAGNPAFQYLIGFFYYDGVCGFDKSKSLAKSYWVDAANSGHHHSIVALAKDSFVSEDWGNALKWNTKAAEIGTQEEKGNANNNLGLMYKYGNGVPMDYEKAKEYFKRAIDFGYAPACFGLGKLLNNKEDAFSVFLQGAKMGNLSCLTEIGNYYYEGIAPVEKDYDKAVYCYQKAAEAGNATAIFNLALCYLKGHGVEKNINKGKSLLQQSAQKGNGRARGILGNWDDYDF